VGTNSYYVATTGGLATSVVNGDVSTVADGNNGVYGPLGAFPNSSSNSTNYFRDVIFQPVGGVSVFTTQTPTLIGQNDHTTYELGMKFTADQAGEIAAIRYWKDAAETGTHVGHIWATNGGELAHVAFTNETGSGWQTAYLSTPIYTSANTEYTVSVNTNGYYVATLNGLATEIVNAPLAGAAPFSTRTALHPGQRQQHHPRNGHHL
jgi:hypothetical protein